MTQLYELDSTRVTLQEIRFGTRLWEIPIFMVLKWLRVRLPSSTDDPGVEQIAPFEIDEESLPAGEQAQLAPLRKELEALGFSRPIYHSIPLTHHHTQIYWITFLHSSGRALARIHHRVWSHPNTYRTYLFPVFLSEMDNGAFLLSAGGKQDLLTPEAVQGYFKPGASAAELWELHQQRMGDLYAGTPKRVDTQDQLRSLIEREHAQLLDFHIARGVFRPAPATVEPDLTAPAVIPAQPDMEQQVLAKLAELQTSKPSWTHVFLILLISLVLFVGAGRIDAGFEFSWLLIPILLFHELGHYVAMRAFGYRNVRMFFIPFFGAAVSGKNYNVAGWKKALVALAGPLPGIALGAILGFLGLSLNWIQVTDAALLLLIINGFNLAPFLPFDGGWVLHATLFCRHPLLDTLFRALAVVAMGAMGILLGGRLYLLVVLLALGLPRNYRVAQVAHRLRKRSDMTLSLNEEIVPEDTARTILAELQVGQRAQAPAGVLAQQILSVFETLNARPPNWLASLGLLALHGGSFLIALTLTFVFFFGRDWQDKELHAPPELEPTLNYDVGTTLEWRGAGAPAVLPASPLVMAATFPDGVSAHEEFGRLQLELPPVASLRLFGSSLVLTLPEDREADRQRWFVRLDARAEEVIGADVGSVPELVLAASFATEAEAEALERELNGYFYVPNMQMLIPPWSAAWQELPPDVRERYARARRTLEQLEHVPVQSNRKPEVIALRKEWSDLARRKDPAADQAWTSLQEAQKAEERRLRAQIVADEDTSRKPTISQLYTHWGDLRRERAIISKAEKSAVQKLEALDRQASGLLHQLSQRMGALPMQEGQVKAASAIDVATGGLVMRRGATVTVSSLHFWDIRSGLSSFAEWLGQRGAMIVRYGIKEAS